MSSQMPGGTDGGSRKRRRFSVGGGRGRAAPRVLRRRASVAGEGAVHRFTRFASELVIGDDGAGGVSILQSAGGGFMGSIAPDIGTLCVQYGVSCQFQLSSLPNATEFTSLFDAYRIDKVELHITYLNNSASGGVQFRGQGNLPTMIHAPDFNDANTPSTMQEIQEYGHARTKRLDQPTVITIRPKIAELVYQGTTAAYSQPSTSRWVNSSYAPVLHYGWKAWVSNFPVSNSGGGIQSPVSILKIQPKYFISCKNTN